MYISIVIMKITIVINVWYASSVGTHIAVLDYLDKCVAGIVLKFM